MIAAPAGREYSWIYLGALRAQGKQEPLDRYRWRLATKEFIRFTSAFKLSRCSCFSDCLNGPVNSTNAINGRKRNGPKSPNRKKPPNRMAKRASLGDGKQPPDQAGPIQRFYLIMIDERSLLVGCACRRPWPVVLLLLTHAGAAHSICEVYASSPSRLRIAWASDACIARRIFADYLLAERCGFHPVARVRDSSRQS